jgi:GNAT superfamily N-acetyltransferase
MMGSFSLRRSYALPGTALMTITARPVAKHDLKLICEHRERMFAESGRTREALRPMTAAFEQWLSPRLADGSYFGWMLEDAGVVIAGLGMMVIDWPPHPSHPADHRRAYILNVFVEPEHRRKGLAKRLMALAEDKGPLARRLLCDPSFDTAGAVALRKPRVGVDERDGDPLGVGEMAGDSEPIIRPRIARRKLVECTETAQQQMFELERCPGRRTTGGSRPPTWHPPCSTRGMGVSAS